MASDDPGRISLRIDVFTRSAKPEVELDIEATPGSDEGSAYIVLGFRFPEDDVPGEVAIDVSGQVEGAGKRTFSPDRYDCSHTLEIKLTEPLRKRYEIDATVRHGIYYSTILPERRLDFSPAFPEVEFLGLKAGRYGVSEGEEVTLKLGLRGPGSGMKVEIWGQVVHGDGKLAARLGKIDADVGGTTTIAIPVRLPRGTRGGSLDVELNVRHRGGKLERLVRDVLSLTPGIDVSIFELSVEPPEMISGESITVSGELVNHGSETASLNMSAGIERDGELILEQHEESLTLDGQPDRDSMGLFFSYEIGRDVELGPGRYSAFMHITGDADVRKSVEFTVSAGGHMTFVGAATSKVGYVVGEDVLIRGLFASDGRMPRGTYPTRAELYDLRRKKLGSIGGKLDIGAETGGNTGGGRTQEVVEWVLHLDETMERGPVNMTVRVFDTEDEDTLLSEQVPFLFHILPSRSLTLFAESEDPPAGKGPIRYLFPDEKVRDTADFGRLRIIGLENDIQVLLMDDRLPGDDPKEMLELESKLFPVAAAGMGMDRGYIREMRENIEGLLYLLENTTRLIARKHRALAPFKVGKGERTAGEYVETLLSSHRERLRMKLESMPRGTKRKMMGERLAVDEYLCQNILAEAFSRAKLGKGAPPLLFDHFTLAESDRQKGGKLLKNTYSALKRTQRWDLDFTGPLEKNRRLLDELLSTGNYPARIKKSCNALAYKNGEGKTGEKGDDAAPEMVSMSLSLLASVAFRRVLDDIDALVVKNGLRHGILLLHDLHVSIFYLNLYLGLAEKTMVHQAGRIRKAGKWLSGFLGRFATDVERVMTEVMRTLVDHRSNTAIRMNAERFRRGIGIEPREQTADPRAGGITRFPLRFINREDSPVAMDLILTVPGDDYRLHWPGSDRQERVYRVKGHVQSPGTGEKEIKIEIPPSVDGEVGSAHLVAIAQRDHLYGRRDSSCVGSRDPGKLELWSEENRFRFPSVRDGLSREQFDGILERIVRRRRSGGKGETVPVVEILAKEMGIPRKRLLHILEDNPVFSLEDVPVKGGFLGLRTVKGHEIRLSNTEECIAGLSSDAPGTISEFALNPVAAVRMISVLAKRLNSLPAVRGGAGRRIVHTPAPPASIQDHGKDERHGETGKGKDEKMLRELRRKRGESITVGGNDYNTLEGLLRALLELGSPELLELASRDHFGRSLSESEGERILGGIFIYLRTRIHLGEIREADIKGELFSRLLDTPLGEPFFEDVLMPKIRSLTRVTTGDATRLLEEVRVAGRRYAPSALSDIIFSLDREIRPLVMRVLGELGDERAMPSLQKMLETSVEREDRIAAMEALLELNTSDSRDIARSAAAGDAELHEVAARRGLTIADKVESDEKKVLLD